MAEIKGTKNNKPSRRPRGVCNDARPNGKAWKRHPKTNKIDKVRQVARQNEVKFSDE